MDKKDLRRLLKRGVAEIIVESEFTELLAEGRPLRLKMGFDPSAPDIHLGHVVGLRKLRQLQELGHKVVLIVGDWTAQIGDPSGASATRPMLTKEQVLTNAETYMAQFFKVVDRDRTETRYQSEWFGSFTLEDVIQLTKRFTVAQFLAREDFAKRYKDNQPIAVTELLYPLLQAYDSVAVEADVEFGGMDQKFNLLVGRDLQQMMGQRPQQLLLVPLMPGTDGVQKMSKSLDNYIGVDEPPNEIFGKAMSLPDTMLIPYFENLTDVPDDEVEEMRKAIEAQSVNPMELKKKLARELVAQFHDDSDAVAAENHFERTIQHRQAPDDMDTFKITPTSGRKVAPSHGLKAARPSGHKVAPSHGLKAATPSGYKGKRLSHVLVEAKLAGSHSEARRLINQGAVEVDGRRIEKDVNASSLRAGNIVKVGKRRFAKLVD